MKKTENTSTFRGFLGVTEFPKGHSTPTRRFACDFKPVCTKHEGRETSLFILLNLCSKAGEVIDL